MSGATTRETAGRGTLPIRATTLRLRSDPAASLTLVAVVMLASLVLQGAPRLMNDLSTQAIRQSVTDAPEVLRNLTVVRNSRIIGGAGPDAFEAVAREQAAFRGRELPESLQAIIADETFVVDSPAWRVVAPLEGEPPPFGVSLAVRYRQGIDDHIRLRDGRLPVSRDPIPVELEGELIDLPLYEVAISAEVQSRLQLDVGSRLLITPDPEDPLAAQIPSSLLAFFVVFEVSGIIEAPEPTDPFWAYDPALLEPTVVLDRDFNVVSVSAAGLIGPADYRSLLRETRGMLWAYTLHYQIDPELITADTASQLATDLQRLESEFAPISLARVTETGFSTGLSRILSGYLERRATTVSVLAIGTAGLVLVSLGVTALLGALIAVRRRGDTRLWRSRGASTWQLVASHLGEGLTLSLVATFLGFLIARQLGNDGTITLPVAAAVALAAAATAVLFMAAVPTVRGGVADGREEPPALRPSLRRLVMLTVVVTVAVGSLVVLRRRGLLEGGGETVGSGFDPLLAMSPALLGLAVGILTVHVYRWLIRPLAWAGARGRRLVPFLGLRRIELQPPSGHLSLVVILLAVAVAVFASVLRVSVEEGQVESSWLAVGADYQVTASSGPPADALDLIDIGEVEAGAVGARLSRLSVRSDTSAVPETADLLAVAISDYAAVLAGTPLDPEPGDEMMEAGIAGGGEHPIPAIVSRRWAQSGSVEPGQVFSLRIGAQRVTFIVAEIHDRFPGMPFDRPFIVADLPTLQASHPALAIRPSVAFIRAPAAAQAAIEQAVSNLNPTATVTSRHQMFNDARDDAFSSGLRRSFRMALGLATVFAAVAGIGGIALTAQARRRHLGYLRTLGVTGRQAFGITLIEHLPPVVLAAVVGAGLGAASADLYEPGIDLGSFTGPGPVASLRIELWSVLVVTVGLMFAIVLAAGLFVMLTSRDELGSTLKMGDE